jgi:formylglycine-generating enzyme required for sulfatase activity
MPDTLPAGAQRAARAPGTPGSAPAKNMVWIPPGEFAMGSND